MCSKIGTPNNHHFLSGTSGEVMVLGVPILKHFRVMIDGFKAESEEIKGAELHV